MLLELQREKYDSLDVQGQLLVDGQFECYTLEPAPINPVWTGHPDIPVGTFKVILAPSARFQMVVPHVLDVPGRSDILIHPGNFPRDTEGCILVGTIQTVDAIGSSRIAFNKLMALLQQEADNLTLVVKEVS